LVILVWLFVSGPGWLSLDCLIWPSPYCPNSQLVR
jgi:hypothetical protein